MQPLLGAALYGLLNSVSAQCHQRLGKEAECEYRQAICAYQQLDVARWQNGCISFGFVKIHQLDDTQIIERTDQRE